MADTDAIKKPTASPTPEAASPAAPAPAAEVDPEVEAVRVALQGAINDGNESDHAAAVLRLERVLGKSSARYERDYDALARDPRTTKEQVQRSKSFADGARRALGKAHGGLRALLAGLDEFVTFDSQAKAAFAPKVTDTKVNQ